MLFTILAGALVGAVVGGLVFLSSIDLGENRDLVAEQVRLATGRQFTLAGEAELAVSLAPKIVIGDVALANADWGSRPQMMTAKRLEAQIRLLPLILGKVSIMRVVLVEPDVLLETDAGGRGNWVFDGAVGETAETPAAASASGGAAVPVVEEILMTGARFAYRDGATGETSELVVDRLSARADGPSSPLEVALSGAYNDQALSLEGTLGAVARIERGEPYPVKVHGSLGGAALTIEGEIGDPMTMTAFDVFVGLKGDDTAALSLFAGYALPALGRYNVAFRLSDAQGGFRVSELSAHVGTKGERYFAVSGSLDDPFALAGFDLSLVLEGRDLATLGALAGVDLPPAGPVDISGRVTDLGRVYTVRDLEASVGASDVAGQVAIDIAGPRPRISGELTSSLLDLAVLLPDGDPTDAAKPGEEAGDGAERVFSDAPLPVGALKTIDAMLALRGDRVIVEGVAFADVVLDLSLAEGALALRIAQARYGESDLTAELSVDTRPTEPAVAARVDVTGLDIGRLFVEFEISDLIEATGDLAINVHGSGNSMRAIMGGLSGRTSLVVGEGHIESDNLDLLAADLLQSIAPWAPDEEVTQFNCFVGRFDVEDGLATSKGFLFDTQRMTVSGKGEIDLGSEELDLVLKPKPKDPSLVSLATPMRVRGVLADPSVAPDTFAVARTAAGAVIGAIATGGIGLIVPFVSIGSDDENPCIVALAEARAGVGFGGEADATAPSASHEENDK
ncbi:MAG: AsmA family protein [Alphaproteobacteria bacterium]